VFFYRFQPIVFFYYYFYYFLFFYFDRIVVRVSELRESLKNNIEKKIIDRLHCSNNKKINICINDSYLTRKGLFKFFFCTYIAIILI